LLSLRLRRCHGFGGSGKAKRRLLTGIDHPFTADNHPDDR